MTPIKIKATSFVATSPEVHVFDHPAKYIRWKGAHLFENKGVARFPNLPKEEQHYIFTCHPYELTEAVGAHIPESRVSDACRRGQ